MISDRDTTDRWESDIVHWGASLVCKAMPIKVLARHIELLKTVWVGVSAGPERRHQGAALPPTSGSLGLRYVYSIFYIYCSGKY